MSANDKQVGGEHYRRSGTDLQHWDLTIKYDWDYFQAQIIKYVMRWKDKGDTQAKRIENLEKARHFLDKYIENAANFDFREKRIEAPTHEELRADYTPLKLYEIAKVAGDDQIMDELSADWTIEGYFGDKDNHYKCRHCGALYKARTAQDAARAHGACPRAHGYTSQG